MDSGTATSTWPGRIRGAGTRIVTDSGTGARTPTATASTNLQEQRARTHPRRLDTDRDGMPDEREDPDRDGLWNITEFRAATAPRDADSDDDGIRDGLEDRDGDGLANLVEQRLGTHPGLRDTDKDGTPDGEEDPDADGLTSLVELARGTDPLDPDTDDDGTLDGREPMPPAAAPVLPGAPGCVVFPADNVWNARIDGRPVAADSATLIASIGASRSFHMDFGSYAGYGIPYQVVDGSTPRVPVAFDYADESDPGEYPIPKAPLIEGGSDRHLLAVDRDELRPVRAVRRAPDRRRGLAGGLGRPVGPGLQRPASGRLDQRRCRGPADPARPRPLRRGGRRRHRPRAPVHGPADPPLVRLPGAPLRVVLDERRAAADGPARPPEGRCGPLGLSPHARVIAVALQRYGMILADNGSPWYVSGMSDPRFDDDVLHELDRFTGADLEVVDTTGLVNGP